MTRQARLLAAVVAMGVVGVLALAFLANRYRDVAPARPVAVAEDAALVLVDRFIEVRRAVKEMIEERPVEMKSLLDGITGGAADHGHGLRSVPTVMEFRVRRGRALETEGLRPEDYVRVRNACKRKREGGSVEDGSLLAALGKREKELAAVDLGPYDALDLAIEF